MMCTSNYELCRIVRQESICLYVMMDRVQSEVCVSWWRAKYFPSRQTRLSREVFVRVGQGFWVFGIQGCFKSGIRYIAA